MSFTVYTKAEVDALIAEVKAAIAELKAGQPVTPPVTPPVQPPVTPPVTPPVQPPVTPPTGVSMRDPDGGPGYFARYGTPAFDDPAFFPLGVWFESVLEQADVTKDKDAGLNMYIVLTANSNFALVKSSGMYFFPQQGELRNNTAAQAAATGWFLEDEVDMTSGPSTGYAVMQKARDNCPADGKAHYTNYGKGVMFWETEAQASKFVNNYQEIVSVDTYWFTDPNIAGPSEGGGLLKNGQRLTATECRRASNYGYTIDKLRNLDNLDGKRVPVWAFIEVGWPFSESASQGGRTITAAELKAAVWHSIIAGARGIVYFNHSFGGPAQSQHCLRESAYAGVRTAVKETNALIKQLAPVLNAPFADGYVTSTSSVRAMAKAKDGKYWVFAGSKENVASTATFTVKSGSSATVVGENRSIPIGGGTFTDTFADGNAVHIYAIS